MTTALILAAAAVAFINIFWSRQDASPGHRPLPPLSPPAFQIPESGKAAPGPHPATLAAILLAGAMVAFAIRETRTPPPSPSPHPDLAHGLDLRGLFVGPEASADAATTDALMSELADVVEWDGRQKSPRIVTGSAVHELRTAARELRCRGVRLGDRQPAVRDAIKAYLDKEAGTDGGPLDDAERARWVEAYRTVSKAARAAR